jgi:hypothetical protein
MGATRWSIPTLLQTPSGAVCSSAVRIPEGLAVASTTNGEVRIWRISDGL